MPPVVFKGLEISPRELSLEELAGPGRRIAAAALNCSQCGGSLELRAPDQAERIWCPNCGAGRVEQGERVLTADYIAPRSDAPKRRQAAALHIEAPPTTR